MLRSRFNYQTGNKDSRASLHRLELLVFSQVTPIYSTTRIDSDIAKSAKPDVVNLSLLPPAFCLLP